MDLTCSNLVVIVVEVHLFLFIKVTTQENYVVQGLLIESKE